MPNINRIKQHQTCLSNKLCMTEHTGNSAASQKHKKPDNNMIKENQHKAYTRIEICG